MPSFDITSEADMVALKNAIDQAGRLIGNRHDFKGTSAKAELNDKDKVITVYGDSDFQINQIKDILFPQMEKKEVESTKRLEVGAIQVVGGNKAKQELKIKVQASIQGEAVRVTGAKRDLLQDTIALVKKSITDFPLQYGNFRD